MAKTAVMNIEGKKVSDLELNDSVFAAEFNEATVHNVVVMQLANKRQGTQSTKTRAEVAGGGRKPWRQKGTGRARVGSSRNPVWKGGGIAFGPKPRDYSYTMPKKARRVAMKSVLSDKLASDNLIVLDALNVEPKTKEMIRVLGNLKVDKKALVVTNAVESAVVRSASNIQGVKTAIVDEMNVYDVVNADVLIMTEEAIKKIEEVLANA
ncbi:50S ribosomal protein L4 [Clostridia bacterium]|nr:50S ribosomal protein L4 [Clostridia bacterium]